MEKYQLKALIPQDVLDLPLEEWAKFENKRKTVQVDVTLNSSIESFRIEMNDAPVIILKFYLTDRIYVIRKSDWNKDLSTVIGEINNLVSAKDVKNTLIVLSGAFSAIQKILSEYNELVNSVDAIVQEYISEKADSEFCIQDSPWDA